MTRDTERFLRRCLKSESKIITTSNLTKGKCHEDPIRTPQKQSNYLKRGKARVTLSRLVSVAFDWFRQRRAFSVPITERSSDVLASEPQEFP